ncbi:hypothetical protein NXH58_00120 [Agathobacter ruminis]|uniref:hypothetical protein n=1 Tax=Agathobacter ruminis TaxID=1712665 RepID=UPI00234E09B8|nr:hypothetical protein [Agathobacter ruminis]MDC7300197.1 hypothetical protein [Agathobacter ruminis]
MRKKTIEIIWALMLITMLCCMQGCAFIHSEKNHIYFNNAEHIRLVYKGDQGDIDVEVTDEDDIKKLKENFDGYSYKDYPSCGFGYDYAVVFEEGDKKTWMCIAFDECNAARINETDMYIDIKDRKEVNQILQKYGIPEIGPF